LVFEHRLKSVRPRPSRRPPLLISPRYSSQLIVSPIPKIIDGSLACTAVTPQGDEWRGIVILNEVKDGSYDLLTLSLDCLRGRFS